MGTSSEPLWPGNVEGDNTLEANEKAESPDLDLRLETLESELSRLKIEVQQTLTDMREHVLEFTNPFSAESRRVRELKERAKQAAETNLTGAADAAGADVESLLEALLVEEEEAAPVAEKKIGGVVRPPRGPRQVN